MRPSAMHSPSILCPRGVHFVPARYCATLRFKTPCYFSAEVKKTLRSVEFLHRCSFNTSEVESVAMFLV